MLSNLTCTVEGLMTHLGGMEVSKLASLAELREKVGLFERARVLIVGDVMLDRFIYGRIGRLSPEAPVPVLEHDQESQMLGGAGNVAANVRSLGGVPLLVGMLGSDREAEIVRGLCRDLDISSRCLVDSAVRRTSVKTRFIAYRQQLLRFDVETVTDLAPDDREAILAAFNECADQADIVVLSDYGKGVLCRSVVSALILRAKARDLTILVDPKGSDYSIYRGATYITPNLKELHEATRQDVSGDEAIAAAARSLISSVQVEAIIATRSEQGISIIHAEDAVHIPTRAREVFDVSGAGDTVVAALAIALAHKMPVNDAASIANAAAGVAVTKLGTAQVTREELLSALTDTPNSSAPGLVTLGDAIRLADTWRKQGLTIGFTNGCFDILHPGHISLLEQAKQHCDRLFVGLNDDASVTRLKGAGRPINSQQSRSIVLAALKPVDAVVLFAEDTPDALIRALVPDVLVKGADYTLDQIVGADFVLSRGGRVERAILVENQSTTAIAARRIVRTN